MKHSDLTPCVSLTGSSWEPGLTCISVKASRLSRALGFLSIKTGEHGSFMSCTSLLALNISPTLFAFIPVSVYTRMYLPLGENPRVSRAGVVEGSWGLCPSNFPSSVSPYRGGIPSSVKPCVLGLSSKEKREEAAAFVQLLLLAWVRPCQSPSIRWMWVCFLLLSCSLS